MTREASEEAVEQAARYNPAMRGSFWKGFDAAIARQPRKHPYDCYVVGGWSKAFASAWIWGFDCGVMERKPDARGR